MAKEELFRSRIMAYFIGGLGSFPVHRGQPDRKALLQAENILSKGQVLIIFPEATRSQNAQLQSAYPGSALIALRSGAPILPVGISGTEQIKGMAWLLRRPRVTVNIGRPFPPPPVDGKVTRAELNKLTNLILERIAELLPREYRRDYSDKEN